jgi:hypothetical protein
VSSLSTGTILIVLGLSLAVIGLIVYMGGFGWFGRLPGDIRIERETTRIYIPFASMIVITLVLNLLFYLVRRFL